MKWIGKIGKKERIKPTDNSCIDFVVVLSRQRHGMLSFHVEVHELSR